MGTGTSMNFYLRVWVRIQIFTRSLFVGGQVIALPGPLPSLGGWKHCRGMQMKQINLKLYPQNI
jgi:hypothetical protein